MDKRGRIGQLFTCFILLESCTASILRSSAVGAWTDKQTTPSYVLDFQELEQGTFKHRGLPLPEVVHYKESGNGYTKQSPLYSMQEAIRKAEKQNSTYAFRAGQVFILPVSTTMECIINLTTQFFVVFTALTIVTTLNWLKAIKGEFEEKCLRNVAETVALVPMLCILFFAARMRAVQLSGSAQEEGHLPQPWVKISMRVCTWSMLLLTALEFVCTAQWGEMWESVVKKQGASICGKLCLFVRHLVLGMVYICILAIIIGICVMDSPAGVWAHGKGPDVSPAVICTIALSILYFAVYLAYASAKTVSESGLWGQARRFGTGQEMLRGARDTVACAPMLCVLFITVRIRALKLDSHDGNPQPWVQVLFYVCLVSVSLQTLISVLESLLGLDESIDGPQIAGGRASATGVKWLIAALQLLAFLALYVSVCAIIVGVCYVSAPVPTAIQCTMLLAGLYFVVYAVYWIVEMHFRFRSQPSHVVDWDFIAAMKKHTGSQAKPDEQPVDCCPMFSILFLGTLLRAMQLTDGRGQAQRWCQDFQMLATWSIVVLALVRIASVWKRPTQTITTACTVIQYLCLLLLYSSAVAIVVALFTMTSETAMG